MINRRTIVVSLMLVVSGFASAQGSASFNACGSLQSPYGPYDYRVERYGRLLIVERAHFTPEVEAGIRGNTGYLGADLNYTLMTSPNHHRALVTLVRYGERTKTSQPPNMQYSIDCYFNRAIRFQQDDTVVRELYAEYLGKNGRSKEAMEQLEVAAKFAKDNALSHYNIGLIYFELKDYDRALAQAHIASVQGYARPELSDKLKSVGKWQDPLPTAEAPVGAASAASAASAAP